MTETVKVRTGWLSGAALDWAVAKACNEHIKILPVENVGGLYQVQFFADGQKPFWPHFSWEVAGEIINKQHSVSFYQQGADSYCSLSMPCSTGDNTIVMSGKSKLEAFCRAYARGRLGEEIEVPAMLEGATP